MSRIKHLETRIVTLLGIEDDEGNIVQNIVLQADNKSANDPLLIRKLNAGAFEAAYAAIIATRAQVEKQVEEKQPKE